MILEWKMDPILLSLGPIHIRWYGLLFASGFLIGYRIMTNIFIREKKPTAELDRLLLFCFAGTLIGARLGHCLFYEPEIYLNDPIRIFKIWEGGLASHGGTLGMFIAMWIFDRHQFNPSRFWLLDRLVIAIALVSTFIRLGNLMNSEILGKPTDGTWGVIFRNVDSIPRHPSMMYESLWYFGIFILLRSLYQNQKLRNQHGLFFGIFFVLTWGGRAAVELVKENQVAFENSMEFNMGQLLSIPFILMGAAAIVYSFKKHSGGHLEKPAKAKR